MLPSRGYCLARARERQSVSTTSRDVARDVPDWRGELEVLQHSWGHPVGEGGGEGRAEIQRISSNEPSGFKSASAPDVKCMVVLWIFFKDFLQKLS